MFLTERSMRRRGAMDSTHEKLHRKARTCHPDHAMSALIHVRLPFYIQSGIFHQMNHERDLFFEVPLRATCPINER